MKNLVVAAVNVICIKESSFANKSVCLMMIHFVTPTKDRPNHRCSKNYVKSGERDLAKTKKSLSLKVNLLVCFVYVDL